MLGARRGPSSTIVMSARVKFKDAGLPGCRRVTIGNALTKDGVIEVRTRRDGREVRVSQDRVVDTVVGLRATRAGEEASAAG